MLGQSRCARRLGQQRQAEALASQALNLKPSWFHAYYARCRARVELGRLQEAYQDIVEASRLEPDNRVIKRYRIRLGEEGAKLGLKLSSHLHGSHGQMGRRYGSSDSLGGASISSEVTIREPPMPPPRVQKSSSENIENQHSKSQHETPRPRPRTNPFYSMSSYKNTPTPIKSNSYHQPTQNNLKQNNPTQNSSSAINCNQQQSTVTNVTNNFSYLSLNREPEHFLTGKPKQTDL